LERGLYILVRTSNPGAREFQDLQTARGPLYTVVAHEIAAWSEENLSQSGFGDVGAVVGATSPRELSELRAMMPLVPFLVPGYGAQGGTAADCRAAFSEGKGAVINSSRGILFPYQPDDPKWEEKIVAAARNAATELFGVMTGTEK
jgi:orotidine-5'-phosphate decarboxylase